MTPSFAARQQYCLFRTPEWRWRRAQWLVEHQRLYSPRHDDADTGRAVRYLRGLAPGRGGAPHAVRTNDPELHQARALFDEGGATKFMVEARLLARQDIAEVALHTSVAPAVLHTYEAVFFNCNAKLDARDWVAARVIHAGSYHPIPLRAAVVLKQFAYYGGLLVLDAVAPYLVGGKDCFALVSDRSAAGKKERTVRLAVAIDLLPDDAGTRLLRARLRLLETESYRQTVAARAPAAAGAQDLEVPVAAAAIDQDLDVQVAAALQEAHLLRFHAPEPAWGAAAPVGGTTHGVDAGPGRLWRHQAG